MRILVTGGAGFVPSSLVDRLAKLPGTSITAVDSMLTGHERNICRLPNTEFIKADVNDDRSITAIMTSKPFDYVFHYAAVVGVARTLRNPIMVLDDIAGIKRILELCKNTGVRRVFFSSSSEVYGEPVEVPQHEERTPLNARLPYAVVKSIGECFCRAYQQEHGLPYTIFRFFNTYGPKQNSDFVVSKFIGQAMAGEDITIYGDGEQTRTFCYIDDNLDFTLKTLLDELFVNDVVNIGHSDQITVKKLAEVIIELTNSKSKIKHLPPLKEGDMARRQPDNRKMINVLGRELIPLREGLSRILAVR